MRPASRVPAVTLGRLISLLAPDRIILFGSRARGTARPGSDIDLLLIGSWTSESARLLRYARQLVAHSFPPIDLVLCTLADVAAAEDGRAPFLLSVIESGVLLWQQHSAKTRSRGSAPLNFSPQWPSGAA